MTEEQKIKRAKELYGNLVYPKTHIELFVDGYLAGVKELEQENRLLGERYNQLLKNKGDLTDQIADIKANCDFAIEGRDVKIADLEKQIEQIEKVSDYNADQLTKAKEMLQTVFDKWKKERWILQSENEVKQIENLMKQVEQFIKEIEK